MQSYDIVQDSRNLKIPLSYYCRYFTQNLVIFSEGFATLTDGGNNRISTAASNIFGRIYAPPL